jgi:large subunit ribosomal protein L25
MATSFVVSAEPRADQGKGASRRLRRTGKVPAVLYGGKGETQMIALSHNEMSKHVKNEAFFAHILTLKLAGESQQVVIKDLQRNPVNESIIHADFLRVLADVAIRMQVPLHFVGGEVAPGVKVGGGVIEHHLSQVEVSCLPKDLPEFIQVDLSKLELNEAIHLSKLPIPAGVELVDLRLGKDASVAAVHIPRAVVEEVVATAEIAPAEVPAMAQKAPEAGAAGAEGAKPEAGKKEEKKEEKKK